MKKYDILIELTEKNIEFLFNCLKIVLSRDEALKIFSHMLLRCHHNPAPFHKIIKLFPEVFTELKAENSISSTRCLRDLVELCHIQMYIHSGFPDLYEPVLKLTMETPTPALTFIKAVIEKYSSKCWGSSTPVVLSWSTREFLSMSPTKRLGLYNLSNTCYMNCTVQVLFLLDDFRRHLLKLSPSSKKILLYEMQRLFSFLLSSQRPAISPKSFYQASKPTWFNAFEQQDCVEFFSQSSVVNLNPFKLGDILKDEWYLFNDERVTYTEFMSSEKLGNYPQDTPYLLIYRMIDNKLISNAVGPQITLEQDQNFIPGRFKMEIRKDNAAFHKEEDSIITLSTGNKRKRDFDPNERGPPGSCGGGGNSSFSQIDTAGAKFIF
ncbi:USP35_38 [Acanthosepion pharaonis]|uniref:USP35_38 n=1 Tax=Acanthosepion pharaonis TaxID=158019 RepID=A0A812C2N5_ACAPH|nr:USP35_38 [Sepia pharaonis]